MLILSGFEAQHAFSVSQPSKQGVEAITADESSLMSIVL